MSFKEILEIAAASVTIIAGIIAISGVVVAWKKRFFHNLHKYFKHHAFKIKQEEKEEK